MTVDDISGAGATPHAAQRSDAANSALGILRALAIAAGVICAILFIVIGLAYGLQMYADGSIFSYAVAVQDAWAFHWHNISARATVYLFAMLPAELFVALTKNPHGGIALYGFLFFASPLVGLLATYALDRSPRRIFFSFGCGSTALLCPLVFGFPTEVWMAHALFWPTLAACHFSRGGIGGTLLIFVLMLALVFSHAGALIFAFAIVASLWLRGPRDAAFQRTGGALLVALLIWLIVKVALPPDDYISAVLASAALHVFDPSVFEGDLMLLIGGALASFGLIVVLLRRLYLPTAPVTILAAIVVALSLAVYWLWFDRALHGTNRYFLRTVILIGTPALGLLAAAYLAGPSNWFIRTVPLLPQLLAALKSGALVRAAIAAFALVMLIHAVETAKFVRAWSGYKDAVRALAMGAAADPALGDPRFVSSARIGAGVNRLAWASTTPYLSVLLAPDLVPARLVVDPAAQYFWLSCDTATANLDAERAVPAESRKLIAILACLHR